jgi:hypothetical protein
VGERKGGKGKAVNSYSFLFPFLPACKQILQENPDQEQKKKRRNVGLRQTNRAIEAMRAFEGIGSEGPLREGHGNPRRGEQRPESRRPRHCMSSRSSLYFYFNYSLLQLAHFGHQLITGSKLGFHGL